MPIHGLSPRMRGTGADLGVTIPAYAGEPWVYPRVCGGTSCTVMLCTGHSDLRADG